MTEARPITGAGQARVWACYCRLSQAKNDGRGGSLAIDRQCYANAEYVARVDPGAVLVHFHDDGVSGWSLGVVRAGFDQALAAIKAGEVHALVAWHADRISRQVEVTGRVVRICRAAGVELHTALGGHHEDPMALQMQSIVAEAESRQKANRAMSKHAQLRKSGGYFGGGRKYGYEPRMTGIVESEAAVIRDMANRILTGESVTSVCKSLNAAGISTVTGTRTDKATGVVTRVPWSIATIRKMLTSPHIVGRRADGETYVDATWPGILDLATWESLRAVLLDPARDTRKGKAASRYLLSGIARCGKCGGRIGGVKVNRRGQNKGGLVYRCLDSFDMSRGMVDTDERVIDHFVLPRLEEIDANGAFVSDADNRELAALVAERDQTIPARRAEYAAMGARGELDPATVGAMSRALAERETEVTAAIGLLSAQVAAPQRALEGATGPNARAVWASWGQDPTGAGFARQRAVIALLVDVEFLATTTGPRFDKDSVRVTYRDLA